MNEVGVNDRVWMLHCKNEKCNEFFDYFGPVAAFTNISCTHCGKSAKHGLVISGGTPTPSDQGNALIFILEDGNPWMFGD